MWVEVLKSKDQALDFFKKIVKRVEVESDNKLKALRTDRGERLLGFSPTSYSDGEGAQHIRRKKPPPIRLVFWVE